MSSFKHRAEYALLKGLINIFRVLPHVGALTCAVGVAWIIHHLTGWRRKEARRRIREVFGSTHSDREIRRIAWISFRNLWLNSVELIHAKDFSDEYWSSRVDTDGIQQKLNRLREEGRGLIVALVHAGNWDLAGVLTSRRGIPSVFIARKQKNPLVNGLMDEFREMAGALVVDRDDPHLVRKVVRALKENRLLAILIDLRARSGGFSLPFLGKTATVGAGLGVIAQLSGAPVLPIFLSRRGWQGHNIRFGEPLRFDADADKELERARILKECLEWLGEHVRAQPEQYFWYNKRWVLEPLTKGTD